MSASSWLETMASLIAFWLPPLALGCWMGTKSRFALAGLVSCVIAWGIVLIRAAAS